MVADDLAHFELLASDSVAAYRPNFRVHTCTSETSQNEPPRSQLAHDNQAEISIHELEQLLLFGIGPRNLTAWRCRLSAGQKLQAKSL